MAYWERKILPVVPLRGLIVFPNTILELDFGRQVSLSALEELEKNNDEKLCVAITQRDSGQVDVQPSDLYTIGTLIRIQESVRVPGKAIHVIVKGIERVKILRFQKKNSLIRAEISPMVSKLEDRVEQEANIHVLLKLFEQYQKNIISAEHNDLLSMLKYESDLQVVIDKIAACINELKKERYAILAEEDVKKRSFLLMKLLQEQIEIHRMEEEIHKQVCASIEKGQKEYYLREQIRIIHAELGEDNSPEKEAEEFRTRLEKLSIKQEEKQYIWREISRYSTLPQGSHEASPLRSWIELALSLPWNIYTQDCYDLEYAKKILDRDHYGLEKIKERILEHLAVCKLRDSTKGTILCLYGPPGVGKTSIAASIAQAMGRNFIRVSLGGVYDEADIRGHRRTYIGSMSGRIIQGMKQAGSMNPIILLDEIDKVNSAHQGDPTAALLEVLDSEQNNTFRDHYLEIPFDLSKTMFIVTANNLSMIPAPLLDRLEIVEMHSYTIEEKIEIAEKFLLSKQIVEHALPKHSLSIPRPMIEELIMNYTKEAGVRNLERVISELCRKVALQIVLNGRKRITFSKKNLQLFLGVPLYSSEMIKILDGIGMVNGLAWTSVGGKILCVEATIMRGNGKLHLTGQLGDIMKESAQTAFDYIRANLSKWNLDAEKIAQIDIHIHMPEGAIPKDGPSAGITIATAIVSVLSGREVRADIAMTGEISLRGRVLPIGGLKEKVIAAQREGMSTVIVPKGNQMHVLDLPKDIQKSLQFKYIDSVDEAIVLALKKQSDTINSKDIFH